LITHKSAQEAQSGGGPLPAEQEHTLSRAVYVPRDGSATLGAGDGNSSYNADHRWSLRLCHGTQGRSVPEQVGRRDTVMDVWLMTGAEGTVYILKTMPLLRFGHARSLTNKSHSVTSLAICAQISQWHSSGVGLHCTTISFHH
jgi:hypothetical protein